MSELRRCMIAEVQKVVLPALREAGFKGTFPHLRRPLPEFIDLITFQFDKWGGGLIVEIARSHVGGETAAWGAPVSPKVIKAWDIHPRHRKRIRARPGSGRDAWFRFDLNTPIELAIQIKAALEADGIWDDVLVPGDHDRP